MAAHWKKRETTFSEYGASFSLPGAWQLRPTDNPCRWHYRSSDKREQLTVTLEELEGYDEEAEINRAAQKARRTVDLSFRRLPDYTVSDTEFDFSGEHPESLFCGSAGDDSHRFWMSIIIRNGQIWSFFFETFRLSEETARAHLDSFRSSLSFR